MREKLVSLQIMRGVAALLVVMGHGTVLKGSSMAAELFFIISGFIMMYVTQDGIDRFWTKRLARIIPLYWLASTAFFVLLRPGTFTVPYFLRSLFFLNDGTEMPFLTVGWTLNCEVRFYLIFGLCARVNQKHRGAIAAAACLAWGAANYLFHIPCYNIPLIPFAFAAGILAYHVYGCLREKPLHTGHKVLLAASIVASAALLHSRRVGSALLDRLIWDSDINTWAPTRPFVYGIPAFIILMSVMLLVRDESNELVKALDYVGDISYSLYLWHIIIQELIVHFFADLGHTITPPSTVSFMLLTLCISLRAADLSYRYLERPAMRYFKQKFAQKARAGVM